MEGDGQDVAATDTGDDRLRSQLILVGSIALVWAPMLVWFAACRPGFLSGDSVNAVRQATTGGWSEGVNPPIWVVFVWSSLQLGSISYYTLAQGLLLAVAIVHCARTVHRAGAPRWACIVAATFLALSPAVGAFSLAVWKDVPYAAVLLMTIAAIVDLSRLYQADGPPSRAVIARLGAGLALLALLRVNAPLIALITGVALLVLLRRWWRPLAVGLAGAAFAFLVVTKVVYPVAGVERIDSSYGLPVLVRDIAMAYRHHPEAFSPEDVEFMSSFMPVENWAAQANCQTVNPLFFSEPNIETDELELHARRVQRLWLHVLRHEPGSVISTHWCASSVALRPWSVTGQWMYTVGPTIDPNDYGIVPRPVVEAWHEPFTSLVRRMDSARWQTLLWRAPGPVYLAYASLGWLAWRTRRLTWVAAACLLFAQQMSFALVAVAQDARYMFPAYLAAVIVLPLGLAASRKGVDGRATPVDLPSSTPVAEQREGIPVGPGTQP